MCNRVAKLVVLGLVVGLTSCGILLNGTVVDTTVVDKTAAHDCNSYWGGSADSLIPLMQTLKGQHGTGWANNAGVDSQTKQALVNLEKALSKAVPPTALPDTNGSGYPTPEEQMQVRDLANSVLGGLRQDGQVQASHPNFPNQDWLQIPAEGGGLQNGPAVEKAQNLHALIKDALDM